MLTFLFWNLNRKDLTAPLVRLCVRHQVDILILAESRIEPDALRSALHSGGLQTFEYARSRLPEEQAGDRRIEIFTRFPSDLFPPIREGELFSIRRAVLPDRKEFLLAALHLPSKRHWTTDSQAAFAIEIAGEIQYAENAAGHQRTALVGDFNMNPFEQGMLAANGFHAMMTRRIAENRQRIVQRKKYSFWYNPMWSHFGDANDTPAGTYYYRQAAHVSHEWNMFDQVLLRPDLLPYFKNEDLQILTTDGVKSFLKRNGTPNERVASDHLPVLFKLRL